MIPLVEVETHEEVTKRSLLRSLCCCFSRGAQPSGNRRDSYETNPTVSLIWFVNNIGITSRLYL